jgi:hypothetical protein
MMMSAAYPCAIVLAFGSCTAATVFLENAATRGELSLPESSETLQLKGQLGSELRLRVVHNDERISEESQTLRIDFLDPPSGMETSVKVPIRKSGWLNNGGVALITIPGVPGDKDFTVSGFLSGVIELDSGSKRLEVPLQLRIAPESIIGPPIEPLLPERTANLLILTSLAVTCPAFLYLLIRCAQLSDS